MTEAAAIGLDPERIERCWKARAAASHAAASGTAPPPSEPNAADAFEDLADLSLVELLSLRSEDASQTPDAAAEARSLRRFVVFERLSRAVSNDARDLAAAEATTAVPSGRSTVPLLRVGAALEGLGETAARRALAEAAALCEERLNPLRIQRLRGLHRAAEELGASSYRSLCERELSVNVEILASSCEGFLRRTEASYLERLENEAKATLGLAPEELWSEDRPALFRAKPFDAHFPYDRIVPVFLEVAGKLGFGEGKIAGLSIETAGPGTDAGAFVSALSIPGDVRLVVPRGEGLGAFEAAFQAGGSALHRAFTRPDLPVASRCLGEPASNVGYGLLFRNFLRDPSFLVERLGLSWEVASQVADASKFRALADLRQVCGQVLFEAELHRAGGLERLDHAAERYVELFTEATGFRARPERFLCGALDAYASAAALRAWMFESNLRRLLRKLWGARFPAHPDAGAFLRQLFAWGDRYTAEEIAEQHHFAPLGIEALDVELG